MIELEIKLLDNDFKSYSKRKKEREREREKKKL